MSEQPIVFSTSSYATLARRVAAAGGYDMGQLETQDFPDGEHYQRIITEVKNREVVLIGGTISDADTLRLFDLSCGITKNGARSFTLIIPYFGYSTMDRAVQAGEVVAAKTRAQLFSAIPQGAMANRVVLVDIHSEGIPYYFEGSMLPVHLYAKPIVVRVAQDIGGNDFVFGSTDAGRAKWVESLANACNVPAGVVLKRRLSTGKVELRAMSAQVDGKLVIVYDDMVRSGDTLIQAARAYKDSGAKSIAAITTHGVFCGKALEKIEKSGLFQTVVTTDSHPRAIELAERHPKFLRVESLAPLLADYLKGAQGAF